MSIGEINVFMPGSVDPVAETKAVYFRPTTAADKVRVGDLVCYNSDLAADYKERTTTPISGGTAYAEGAQNYNARLFVVEKPATANLHAFAGVVAKLGQLAGADGDLIEIFVPNGAIVPVLVDQSCTINSTIVGVRDGAYEGSYPGRPIGIAKETVTYVATDILCWVKVDPNMFGWIENAGSAVAMGASATANIHLIKADYAHVSGYRTSLMVQQTNSGALAASGGSSAITGYINQTGTITGTTGWTRAILGQLNLTGTINAGGLQLFGVMGQVHGSATMTHCEHVAALNAECGLTNNPTTGNYEALRMAISGAGRLDQFLYMYGNGGNADFVAKFDSMCSTQATDYPIRNGGTGNKTIKFGTDWKAIRISIDGTEYWIPAGNTLTES